MLSSPPGRYAFYAVIGFSLLAVSLLWAIIGSQNVAPPAPVPAIKLKGDFPITKRLAVVAALGVPRI